MSQPAKKKVVTTAKKKVKPTTSKVRSAQTRRVKEVSLLFKKQNYVLMGCGVLLIALGFLLMGGGSMPSPDVWDENLIYSFRRVTLAPIVILAGLALEIFAIFKRA